ncbi:MAG: winged helix-turn-helix domain-containing protein [Paludibacter sp.]|nr:winged helix-turn-helix domain-containing protein [Paludibacter sp.]
MNLEKIGINAGVVWKALESVKELDIKGLKKATKLTEKDLNYALGWLAREGKVNFIEDGEQDTFVKLA